MFVDLAKLMVKINDVTMICANHINQIDLLYNTIIPFQLQF